MGKVVDKLGFREVNTRSIWQALLAEFLANLMLNFFGCASCVQIADKPHGFVQVALTFGLVIFILVQTLGHVSGAHINPAVTAGMISVGNITILKGLLYIIVQSLGAIAGSGVLRVLIPESIHNGTLGSTALSSGITAAQGFGFEFFLGFVLVLVVSGVCDENRPEAKPAAALAIGMAVAVGHLACVDITGSSMNPARSLGSAIVSNTWNDHWIYWVGPMLGGIVAAIIYKFAFAAPSKGYGIDAIDEKELKRLDGRKEIA